jgi:hypothetical protein
MIVVVTNEIKNFKIGFNSLSYLLEGGAENSKGNFLPEVLEEKFQLKSLFHIGRQNDLSCQKRLEKTR